MAPPKPVVRREGWAEAPCPGGQGWGQRGTARQFGAALPTSRRSVGSMGDHVLGLGQRESRPGSPP